VFAFLLLGLGGITAGMLGGLLGIGGGILIMPLLRFVMALEPAQAAGTCMVAVFCTTLGGSIKHFGLGHIHMRSILSVMVAGLFATFCSSMLFVYISQKGHWLDRATGLVFALVAVRMLWEGIPDYVRNVSLLETDEGTGIQGTLFSKITIGSAAGILPGLLGIGTGAVLVPAFAFFLNAPIKVAIGSSLACFSLNALLSSALKFFQGFVKVDMLIPLCVGTLIGSRLGAVLNGRVSAPFLKILFGMVFVYVAFKYLGVFGV